MQPEINTWIKKQLELYKTRSFPKRSVQSNSSTLMSSPIIILCMWRDFEKHHMKWVQNTDEGEEFYANSISCLGIAKN